MTGETRSSRIEQLLDESIRTFRHPLISFRVGGAGRREPSINGTRLLVRQVVAQIRQSDGDIRAVAEDLDIPVKHVQAARSYHADFSDEIDADQQWADRMAAEEFARWEREQSAIG
jgi:uncharacterized protein (DUF433 family)